MARSRNTWTNQRRDQTASFHRAMASPAADKTAIETRYRDYCNACQSGQLNRLTEFWSLPAQFTVDFGGPDTVCKIVEHPAELEQLYSTEFGPSTGVDNTTIDTSEVTFFGERLATIEPTLRHTVKGDLHDRQHATYSCRKVDGKWWFVSHISKVDETKAA